ncbi:uncharacterized protein BDR25DRAFT_118150 [Lindgomyces ingoldianus]|uniref:Uncharacterized protein n=1 Tax=Lindgomyces ingoldianus TaxID=673940 RepID=A0ACB6Q7H5_9PLEO|nr:uncharacterized protein BDR25DRAFT_118150 [Lindgomyces ingoldianus]KAF2462868.1 hypothetical protein BDR25DRAFT_118150 [Lindgomyces ingoldianus]
MVNIGRPSRACLSCRQKRIKCDETRPTCKRCSRLKLECGWKDEWTSMVRHQEKWAECKVAKRVEKVQMKRNQRHVHRKPDLSSYVAAHALSMSKQCQIGPEVYAINRFYSDYAFTEGTFPFLHLVAPLYTLEQTPGYLHSALPAVALASSAKQLNRHDMMLEAHRHYGNAVRSLNNSLPDTSMAKHDATLLTVFLLGLYEFITTDRLHGLPSPYHTHGPGRLALLRLRGPEQLETITGRNLFTLLYHDQLISTFLGNGELMDEFPAWMHRSYPPSPMKSMKLLMHEISCLLSCLKKVLSRSQTKATTQMAQIRKRVSVYQSVDDFDHNAYLEGIHNDWPLEDTEATDFVLDMYEKADTLLPLLRKGIVVNEALGNLDLHVQPGWPDDSEVTSHTTGKDRPADLDEILPQDGMLVEDVSVYVGISRAVTLNVYRAMQIHLLQTLLSALPSAITLVGNYPNAEFDFASLHADWTTTIAHLARAICNDIPYVLGERDKQGRRLKSPVSGRAFRAYLMLWPLQVSLDAKETSPEDRALIARRLRYISEIIGIGMAGEIASAATSDLNIGSLDDQLLPVASSIDSPEGLWSEAAIEPALNAEQVHNLQSVL